MVQSAAVVERSASPMVPHVDDVIVVAQYDLKVEGVGLTDA